MVVKKFHLVGTDGNSEHLSVDIGVPPDVQHLRLGLASKYGIIQPEGPSHRRLGLLVVVAAFKTTHASFPSLQELALRTHAPRLCMTWRIYLIAMRR